MSYETMLAKWIRTMPRFSEEEMRNNTVFFSCRQQQPPLRSYLFEIKCLRSVWRRGTNANRKIRSIRQNGAAEKALLNTSWWYACCSSPFSPVKLVPHLLAGRPRYKWRNQCWPLTRRQLWHERPGCTVSCCPASLPPGTQSPHGAVWDERSVMENTRIIFVKVGERLGKRVEGWITAKEVQML